MTFEGQQIQGAAKILEKLQVTSDDMCADDDEKSNKHFFFSFFSHLRFKKLNEWSLPLTRSLCSMEEF